MWPLCSKPPALAFFAAPSYERLCFGKPCIPSRRHTGELCFDGSAVCLMSSLGLSEKRDAHRFGPLSRADCCHGVNTFFYPVGIGRPFRGDFSPAKFDCAVQHWPIRRADCLVMCPCHDGWRARAGMQTIRFAARSGLRSRAGASGMGALGGRAGTPTHPLARWRTRSPPVYTHPHPHFTK